MFVLSTGTFAYNDNENHASPFGRQKVISMSSTMFPKPKELTKRPLFTGTLILTFTGLLSRLIGFFYRIYLSRLFGEENMGIYQLVSPVIAMSFSLTAGSYQTAVSN